MVRISGSAVLVVALLLAAVEPLSAGPKVSVSPKTFDADTVVQGKIEFVRHTFKLKNTGDEPLKIKKVREVLHRTVLL